MHFWPFHLGVAISVSSVLPRKCKSTLELLESWGAGQLRTSIGGGSLRARISVLVVC